MQFIKNGPDVPEKLLQAHEDGSVVFFCGAGISYPAGLPGFGGLVDGICTRLGVVRTRIEQTAFDRGEFDTTVSLLESRVPGGRQAVRKALAAALSPNLTLPDATRTHEALLTLGRNKGGHLRLITTNFDRLFDEAGRRIGLAPDEFHAPLLPVPKKRWDGLVYLHGKLPETANSADLERLVISSGDFGLAYLTERWAARFVSELFRGHTVCFVGYSLNDPVMRYMMDALAADHQLGEAPTEVFAVGGTSASDYDKTADEWRAKNVTPILYPSENHDHSALHRTLQAWADTYRDGVRGKEAIVSRYAGLEPTGSTRQDDFVGRMLWALCDPSGLPAKTFADADPAPSLAWLDAFSETRFGHRDLARFRVNPDPVEDTGLSFSFVARPAPYSLAPLMRLVRHRGDVAPRWDNVMPFIARWLLRHLDDPTFLLWVVGQGGAMHDSFIHLARAELEVRPPRAGMEVLWRLMISGHLAVADGRRNPYEWIRRLSTEGLTPLLRFELRELLKPKIRVRAPYKFDETPNDEPSAGPAPRDLVNLELVLNSEHAQAFLQALKGSPRWELSLPEVLETATGLLADAMDLLALVHLADETSDSSHWQRASIGEHPQNQTFRDWTVLIDILRDAWLAMARLDPARATREVRRWSSLRYPIFRRFVFFALAERRDLFSLPERLGFLLSDDGWWMWSVETHREAMVLLRGMAKELNPAASKRLQRAILKGPPTRMFREDTDAAALQRIFERETWLRLAALVDAGADPIAATLDRLASFAAQHPQHSPPTERDDFPVWIGDAGELREVVTTPFTIRELIQWLRDNSHVDDLHLDDDWRDRCRSDFRRTAAALCHLALREEWPTERWQQALQAWSEPELRERSWRCLSRILIRAPGPVISGMSRALAWWLNGASKTLKVDQDAFFTLVNKVLAASHEQRPTLDDDPLFTAINHPVGLVTEAVFNLWYALGLEDNQGIAGEIRAVFDLLCDGDVPAYRHGRIILARNVISLFRVDQSWTQLRMVPRFNWRASTEEARLAWTGYLWSPRFYPPLLTAISQSFLETAERYSQLGQVADNYASLLTFAALEGEPFTIDELRKATAALPEDGLGRALVTLQDGLRTAGDRRQEHWRNRTKPYWTRIWPKSRHLVSPAVATGAAGLAIAAGDDFPEAVAMVRDWLVPLPHPDHVLRQLLEAGHCARFPQDALALMGAVVGSDIAWSAEELRSCLISVRDHWHAAVNHPEFTRLELLVRQAGQDLN